LDRDECWWSTDRSSWLGHQSLLVRGRCDAGSGEGIPGFSLSLSLRVLGSVTTGSPDLLFSDGLVNGQVDRSVPSQPPASAVDELKH
jgi:hypothetical protein